VEDVIMSVLAAWMVSPPDWLHDFRQELQMKISLVFAITCMALILITPQTGAAQSYGMCTDKPNSAAAFECLAQEIPKAEAALVLRRNQIRHILQTTPELVEQFNAVEAQWDGSRKLLCEGLIDQFYAGGTIRAPNALACMMDAAQSRHDFLTRLFKVQLPR
jgi:uncharacterized protein YecT (DUF1311 family)